MPKARDLTIVVLAGTLLAAPLGGCGGGKRESTTTAGRAVLDPEDDRNARFRMMEEREAAERAAADRAAAEYAAEAAQAEADAAAAEEARQAETQGTDQAAPP